MKRIALLFLLNLLLVTSAYCQIITTIAGGITGHGGYWGDGGPATAAEMGYIAGIAVDKNGNTFISDANNQRIRKVDAVSGIITTIAGTGIGGFNGDGINATSAQVFTPECISFDNNGNLFFYDYGNSRIRRIDAVTGIISTFAGNGTFGTLGDNGPATSATIDGGDMAWDAAGNLYFTATRKIRKITPAGIISTFAGNGLPGITADGVPATATFLAPMRGLAFDAAGNLYCADSTLAVRKIAAGTGIITRVAGTGDNMWSPYAGDGVPATSCHMNPFDISVDPAGILYISDYGNSRIEKVNTSGIIQTIAGTGVSGFSGDNGPATAAKINLPENVVLDKCGNVYIADFNNKRVRKVTYPPTLTIPTISLSGESTGAIVGSTVTVTATVTNAGSSYLIHWLNHGVQFATTSVPSVTYIKPPGIDTITARVVSTSYGCYDSTTSAPHIVKDSTVGVSPLSPQGELIIYPNPVNDVLHIDWARNTPLSLGEGRGEAFRLLNIVGSTLLHGSLKEGSNSISLKSLPSGMYMLEVTGSEEQKTIKKIIKQ